MGTILGWFRRILGYERAELRGWLEGHADGVEEGWTAGWEAGNWHGYHDAQDRVSEWYARDRDH